MFDFKDRVLLVTGAGGGIGGATAAYFHACGARVMMADINEAAVVALARSLDPSAQQVRAQVRGALQSPDGQDAPADAPVGNSQGAKEGPPAGGLLQLAAAAGAGLGHWSWEERGLKRLKRGGRAGAGRERPRRREEELALEVMM